MRADQLRSAAGTIAELLKKSDLLNSIRQHRDAREERQRQATRSRLSQSAKILLTGSRGFSEAESKVSSLLHLDKASSVDYWQALLNEHGDQSAQHSELVQLYSRVMFASSHLPSLLNMVSDERSAPAAIQRQPGENTLILRLSDAGEKASDPDRIARAIDGIDMIYAASISLSRRPSIDLQLREISGHPEKLLVFLGDDEGVSALYTILESIPAALERYRDDEELDLAQVVGSLPIFDDLATLAETGSYSDVELRDIDDTMHQGVMLALESGVVCHHMPPPVDPDNGVTTLNKRAASSHARPNGADTRGFATEAHARYGGENEQLEHYRDNDSQYRDPQYRDPQSRGPQPAESQHRDAAPVQTDYRHSGPEHDGWNRPDSSVEPQRRNGQADRYPGNGAATHPNDDGDEYYQHYLEERERLRDGEREPLSPQPRPDRENRGGKSSAFTSLFKGLGRSKDKHRDK